MSGLIGRAMKFAKSKQGKQAIAKVSNYAKSDEGKKRIGDVKERFTGKDHPAAKPAPKPTPDATRDPKPDPVAPENPEAPR
jgi:hypothetical protein